MAFGGMQVQMNYQKLAIMNKLYKKAMSWSNDSCLRQPITPRRTLMVTRGEVVLDVWCITHPSFHQGQPDYRKSTSKKAAILLDLSRGGKHADGVSNLARYYVTYVRYYHRRLMLKDIWQLSQLLHCTTKYADIFPYKIIITRKCIFQIDSI